jgi:peptidyl-tRNA hydrolase
MNIKKILEESLKRGGSKVTLPVKEANSLLTILSQIMGAGIKEATTKI